MEIECLSMDFECGNAGRLDTNGTGWFIGFSEWCRGGSGDLRHMPVNAASTGLCVKFKSHPAGQPNGEDKPISVGRTVSILVGAPSVFRIELSPFPDFPPEHTTICRLREPGDYAMWGPRVYHRVFGTEPASILTLRWQPQD